LVVRRLAGGVARADTGAGRRRWIEACLALDAALQTWSEQTRALHNAEVDARDAARLASATPNEKLRTLMGGALAKIREVGALLERDPASRGTLVANADRLKFLQTEVLAPTRVHELLSPGQDEARVRGALEAIHLVPRDFLTSRFDELFDDLCGARWAARQAAPSSLHSLLPVGIDGRWHTLSIRLLAATWCSP
jgi:hypothetical protein